GATCLVRARSGGVALERGVVGGGLRGVGLEPGLVGLHGRVVGDGGLDGQGVGADHAGGGGVVGQVLRLRGLPRGVGGGAGDGRAVGVDDDHPGVVVGRELGVGPLGGGVDRGGQRQLVGGDGLVVG